MKIRLFSHTDLDGYGCNVIANVFFGEENVEASNHNYDKIDKAVIDFLHSNELNSYDVVLITDLSVSDETAERIDKYITSGVKIPDIVLLDHHKSAERLNKYNWCWVETTTFDEAQEKPTCGTMMLFRWCMNVIDENLECASDYLTNRGYSDGATRCFVKMVRDWDTWEWKNNPDSWGETAKELNDLFYIYGYGKFVSRAMKKVELGSLIGWSDEEQALLDNRKRDFLTYLKQKDSGMIRYDFTKVGYMVGVVFADRYISELGNELCSMHPELDCVVIANLGSGSMSFRSTKDEVDVTKIAEWFGGGGHVHAAGALIPQSTRIGIVNHLLDGGIDHDN